MKNQTFITNQRDKNLLIILLGIILAFLLFYFVTTPAMDQNAVLRAEAQIAKADLEHVKMLVAQLPDLKTQENEKKQQLIDKYTPFFYNLNEEGVLFKLDGLMAEAGLNVGSYSSSLLAASTIPVPGTAYIPFTFPLKDLATITNPELADQNPPAGQAPAEGEAGTDAVATVDITVSYGPATYPTIVNFISKLEGLNKTMVIKNLNAGTGEGGGPSGSVTLSLYSLPKLDQSEAQYLQFFPAFGKGKIDPFQ